MMLKITCVIVLIALASCKVARVYNVHSYKYAPDFNDVARWNKFDTVFKDYCGNVNWAKDEYKRDGSNFVILKAGCCVHKKFIRLMNFFWNPNSPPFTPL